MQDPYLLTYIHINTYSILNDNYFFPFTTHIKKLNVPFKTYMYKSMQIDIVHSKTFLFHHNYARVSIS